MRTSSMRLARRKSPRPRGLSGSGGLEVSIVGGSNPTPWSRTTRQTPLTSRATVTSILRTLPLKRMAFLQASSRVSTTSNTTCSGTSEPRRKVRTRALVAASAEAAGLTVR